MSLGGNPAQGHHVAKTGTFWPKFDTLHMTKAEPHMTNSGTDIRHWGGIPSDPTNVIHNGRKKGWTRSG